MQHHGSAVAAVFICSVALLGQPCRAGKVLAEQQLGLLEAQEAKHAAAELNHYQGRAAPEVNIFAWWGRTGNQLVLMVRALVYGKRMSAASVKYDMKFCWLRQLFQLPQQELRLARVESSHGKCQGRYIYDDLEQFPFCPAVTSSEIHHAMVQYLSPLMVPKLSSCVKSDSATDDGNLLTIHLRSGDIFDKQQGHRQHRQPPCAFYRKAVESKPGGGRFDRILLITSDGKPNPCVKELQSGLDKSISVTVQRGSMLEDSCAILRAQNLVLSYSTFSHGLAMMSSNVRNIFATEMLMDNIREWFDCSLWPGVELLKFGVPGQEKLRPKVEENIRWMLSYPEANVTGPSVCRGPKKE
eukprot:TRINITY_DN10146_c0_g1_i1.p1 TRINITY_DN10146_c0_g1~~TRINITY_DN10146_c0_g1_i1.p1  ORF type:complete len:355 (+),score=81.48 TRINITY_DN10146_c0_g1_i1:103-1167(+)